MRRGHGGNQLDYVGVRIVHVIRKVHAFAHVFYAPDCMIFDDYVFCFLCVCVHFCDLVK